MLSPVQIKAKRIALGLSIEALAEEASASLGRRVSKRTMGQILARILPGKTRAVHDVQQFAARRLKIPVSELKPPFETSLTRTFRSKSGRPRHKRRANA